MIQYRKLTTIQLKNILINMGIKISPLDHKKKLLSTHRAILNNREKEDGSDPMKGKQGKAKQEEAKPGKASHTKQEEAKQGKARKAKQEEARQEKARQWEAWQEEARQKKKAKAKTKTKAKTCYLGTCNIYSKAFDLLGLSKEDSTDALINTAYRKLALKSHPDKNKEPGSVEVFRSLVEAKERAHDYLNLTRVF
jgi:hypothetical protein